MSLKRLENLSFFRLFRHEKLYFSKVTQSGCVLHSLAGNFPAAAHAGLRRPLPHSASSTPHRLSRRFFLLLLLPFLLFFPVRREVCVSVTDSVSGCLLESECEIVRRWDTPEGCILPHRSRFCLATACTEGRAASSTSDAARVQNTVEWRRFKGAFLSMSRPPS